MRIDQRFINFKISNFVKEFKDKLTTIELGIIQKRLEKLISEILSRHEKLMFRDQDIREDD